MDIRNERITADRFSGYIAELREFSESYRIPFGHPEDLAKLLQAIRASEAFAADFGSMIHSVVLREHFMASDAELVTLAAVAWAGSPQDGMPPELPSLLSELEAVIGKILRQGGSLFSPPLHDEVESQGAPLEVDGTIGELDVASPDSGVYRQLPNMQDRSSQILKRERQDDVPPPRNAGTLSQNSEIDDVEDAIGTPHPPYSVSPAETPAGSLTSAVVTTASMGAKASEVLATSLMGLVAALLLTVGSLPIYQSHVSVYLPADTATLRVGQLTDVVADRMLSQPHTSAILRQDILSRAKRDFHLGDSEAILYADLVADAAQHVKVTRIQSRGLYEITCHSWSAQFAAAFCQALIDALPASDSVHVVDNATRPGVQVYPHWYLQGILGLALGGMIGLWRISRPASPASAG